MKLFFALIVGLSSFAAVSAHAATQLIDCRFVDPNNTDHALVTLTSDQAGSFFYSTEGEAPSTTNSDKLILKRIKPISAGFAAFMAEVLIPEGSGSVQFVFEYPETAVMKAGTNVKAKLTTQIFELRSSADTQDLNCSAKMN